MDVRYIPGSEKYATELTKLFLTKCLTFKNVFHLRRHDSHHRVSGSAPVNIFVYKLYFVVSQLYRVTRRCNTKHPKQISIQIRPRFGILCARKKDDRYICRHANASEFKVWRDKHPRKNHLKKVHKMQHILLYLNSKI